MGSSAEAVPTPGCAGFLHFFYFVEKCEKPLDQLVQGNERKTLRSPGLAENLDGHQQDQEIRRSAPKTLLNPVHGENLEDLQHHLAELDCQRCSHRVALSWEKTRRTSTSSTTTNTWNVNVLLHSPLPHRPGHDRRHFHQLFHQLRLANCCSQGDVLRRDLGHFDNLLGVR